MCSKSKQTSNLLHAWRRYRLHGQGSLSSEISWSRHGSDKARSAPGWWGSDPCRAPLLSRFDFPAAARTKRPSQAWWKFCSAGRLFDLLQLGSLVWPPAAEEMAFLGTNGGWWMEEGGSGDRAVADRTYWYSIHFIIRYTTGVVLGMISSVCRSAYTTLWSRLKWSRHSWSTENETWCQSPDFSSITITLLHFENFGF